MTEIKLNKASGSRLDLMGHVIADYPSKTAVREMIGAMARAGAKVIEVQIPFSEPMADGPLFLAANHAALAQGVTYQDCMDLMAESTRAHPDVQFVFMSYLNPVYKRGYQRFAVDAHFVGARGVIIPDLPIELGAPLAKALTQNELTMVRLIAPNVDEARLKQLTADAKGLIYAVARSGVTGASSDFSGVAEFVRRIRAVTAVPVAVGFGVKSPADVKSLRGLCNLAIIGTASLKTYQSEGLVGFEKFWTALATAAGVGTAQ